jgi:hypothetical protein
VTESSSVYDSWRALSKAKQVGWIDFIHDEVDFDSCIDMKEYQHYDSAANGVLHVIIPSKVIAFRCPSQLPDVQSPSCPWRDIDGERHFGPSYYADILSGDFNVQLVTLPDKEQDEDYSEASDSDSEDGEASVDDEAAGECECGGGVCTFDIEAATYEAHGIAVERLVAGPSHPTSALLRNVDRFLTLARLAPGAIALHGPPGGDGGPGGGEMLVSALLIREHGFDARAAIAWVRLAHPSSPPPFLTFAIESKPVAAASAAGSSAGRRSLLRSKAFGRSAPNLLVAVPPPAPFQGRVRRPSGISEGPGAGEMFSLGRADAGGGGGVLGGLRMSRSLSYPENLGSLAAARMEEEEEEVFSGELGCGVPSPAVFDFGLVPAAAANCAE